MNLLVDGNSVFASWFFGFSNGVYGFYNALATYAKDYKPDEIHIAFDDAQSWRKELYPEYKAHRTPKPELYYEQLSRLKEVLVRAGFAVYTVPYSESDDILAFLAGVLQPCVIRSDDKDLLQLITPQVSVKRSQVLWTPSTFENVYNLEPYQFPHLQALMGDEVDNIPGVKDIGPKRAALLIREYGTIHKLYEDLPLGTMGQRLRLDRDNAFLSLELATLRAPVMETKFGSYNLENLRRVL